MELTLLVALERDRDTRPRIDRGDHGAGRRPGAEPRESLSAAHSN
jgi:hypothetical protein